MEVAIVELIMQGQERGYWYFMGENHD